MPPTLILIRHAEAVHNTQTWVLPDPPLTDQGLQQCRDLQSHLQESCPLIQQVELIVSSPMRRALQTTQTALAWLIESGTPVKLDTLWQENPNKPWNIGSSLDIMSAEFPQFDFSSIDASKTTAYAFTRSSNAARGQACLQSVHTRPEKVIAVVSHGGYLRTAVAHRRFANADYRIFTFQEAVEGRLELQEDEETESKGGAMGRSQKGVFQAEDWDFPKEKILV